MKLYILKSESENHRWIELTENYFDFFWNMLDSNRIDFFNDSIKWRTIRDKKDVQLGDFPHFTVPVISQAAYNVLNTYLTDLTQIFPFAMNKKYGQYYFINIINVLDCLDLSKSDINFFSDGRIYKINKFSFNSNISKMNTTIFKIKKFERGDVFVNENIKKIIEVSELDGFTFQEVADV